VIGSPMQDAFTLLAQLPILTATGGRYILGGWAFGLTRRIRRQVSRSVPLPRPTRRLSPLLSPLVHRRPICPSKNCPK